MSKKKAAEPTSLTEVQMFFARGNCVDFTVQQIAAKLAVPAHLVQEYLDSLPNSMKQQMPANPKIAGFETGKGVVSMTGEQSHSDDDKSQQTKVNADFYKEHGKNIHKIRPNDPIK